jgi:para-aminobenzoate synthetase/4-amino-4-deoxychorismate lyase
VSRREPDQVDVPVEIVGSIPARAELRRIEMHSDADRFSVASILAAAPDSAALSGRWCGGGMAIFARPAASATGDWRQIAPLLDALPQIDQASWPADDSTAVGGGIITALGYRALEPDSGTTIRADYYDQVLRWRDGKWWIEQLWTAARSDALDELVAHQRLVLISPVTTTTAQSIAAYDQLTEVVLPDSSAHIHAVKECIERIAAGDLYLANVCTQIVARFTGDAAQLWATMAEHLTPDYAAFVRSPNATMVGLSPELFLRASAREVSTAPIKGTRRRSGDATIDAAFRAALLNSEKDRAENIMIVDLMRNDLGRVCDIGSVHVTDLLKVSAHTGVWHLVSSVAGRLRSDVGNAELLDATFPPGSVTGAPKISAVAITTELEAYDRQLYTGAVGLISPLAGLELAVTIRTLEIAGDQVTLGVGGGITADSDPDAEWDECLAKADPLLAAAGSALPVDQLATERSLAQLPTIDVSSVR